MSDAPEELAFAAEFPAATREQWLKLVDGVLKGAPFDKRLIAKTYDGLSVQPLYPRAADARPIVARTPGAPWALMQRVDHPDPAAANEQALHDLENGATGLTIVFKGSLNANGYGLDGSAETLERALDGVYLDAGVVIDFNVSAETRDASRHFAALVKSRGIAPETVEMRASINPLGHLAATGEGKWKDIAPRFAAQIGELSAQGFRGPFAVADGRVIHNAGGSEAQELAFALASAVTYLRALEAGGLALDAARRMIYFRLAADVDQFLTIAKFRAVRKLWARVEQACGLEPAPTFVAAETAWRMMTRRDPYVNMLRATVAVVAAGFGGADAITVLPFTAALGLPDAFRAAHRAQHAAHPAGRVEPREGCRSRGRLRRHRGFDAAALHRRLGAVPGDREGRRHGHGAGAGADPEQGRGDARRARKEHRAAPRCAHRHERVSRHSRGGCACARCRAPLRERTDQAGRVRHAAAHPPRRAVRAVARCLRPRAGHDRRAAEGIPRQSRQALRLHRAHAVRQRISSRPAASRRSPTTDSPTATR